MLVATGGVGGLTCGRRERGHVMHDRRTPGSLLVGQNWTGLGPSVDVGSPAADVVRLVAAITGRELMFVHDALTRTQGRYLPLLLLTETEHSEVYVAVDRSLARKVAVKIHLTSPREAAKESRLLARLSHPNVVEVHDRVEHPQGEGKWRFSVLELGDCDLVEYCQQERHWTETVARFLEVGAGLLCLHGEGYVHRDFKPANAIVVNEIAKIIDLGSVGRPGRTEPNRIYGTPGFVAPEVGAEGYSFASDVFAFLAALWNCLFYELPFAVPENSDNPIAAIASSMELAAERRFTPPQYMPPGMPDSLVELLKRGLDPDPKQRPTMEQCLIALKAIVEREAKKAERRRRLRRGGLAIAAGAVLVLWLGHEIGAARYSGSGGSIPDAVIRAFTDPLVRAEIATLMGKCDRATEEIYKLHPVKNKMSKSELMQAANRISTIGARMAARGAVNEAAEVEEVAFYFRLLAESR